ncbi:MAG TPA: glucose 1-dehydrogenase, partial [Acidimicrobiia bacterium]|nr:glucose 1-dehydrogenase [Acidimicrobiia bacterium]
MSGLLAGRTALVTGGGGGIGRGISERFAAEGALVVVAEIDAERAHDTVSAINAAGGEARVEVLDVRERDQVDAVAARVGRIDALVNNVGHYGGARGGFLASDEAEWDVLYRINLYPVFVCTRAFAPAMVDAGAGTIINLSTVEAFRGIPNRSVYSAFKAAITGFTKSLALELGPAGVRVNAIAPDLTETLQVPYSRWITEEQQELIPHWVPVGRFGTPHDIAGCALFLASDLSAFVTGTTIHADGGSLAAGGWFRRADDTWTNRPLAP